MTNPSDKAKTDYRELIGMLAQERTLNSAQLATLEIVKEVLGVDDEDTQKDIEVLELHRELSLQTRRSRATVKAGQRRIEETAEEIDRLRARLDAVLKQQAEAEEQTRMAREELGELEWLEHANPRLFPA